MEKFNKMLAAAATLFSASTAAKAEEVPHTPPVERHITLPAEQFIDTETDPFGLKKTSFSEDLGKDAALPIEAPRERTLPTEDDLWDAVNIDVPRVRNGRFGINQTSHGDEILGFRWSSSHTPEQERQDG